jgi:undecaprenyl pyrophosphate phosphatase UppP
MSRNPYEASTSHNIFDSLQVPSASSAVVTGVKAALIVVGMLLYFSNVQRDAHFYRTILENEGFPTTTDSIAVGIAQSLISTLVSPGGTRSGLPTANPQEPTPSP